VVSKKTNAKKQYGYKSILFVFIAHVDTSMKLVSFDIGIKNMAYCVLDITVGQEVQILDWNVVNLSFGTASDQTESVLVKCNCPLKKAGKICGKKAQYQHETHTEPREYKWYCGTHAKSHPTLLLPKKEYELTQIKKKKVGELGVWYQSVLGSVPAGYKKDDMVNALGLYYRNHCFTKVVEPQKVNAKDIDLVSVGRAIKYHFDMIMSFSGADVIVVENQISTIATRMKTIQGMVAQYFIMRNDTADAKVEFVSSVNKLKGFGSVGGKVEEMDTDNTEALLLETLVGEDYDAPADDMTGSGGGGGDINPNYKKHKTDGVQLTQTFLQMNTDLGKWGDHFLKHKKKDDLADCFLQGVWYGSHHKLFSYAENLKINSV